MNRKLLILKMIVLALDEAFVNSDDFIHLVKSYAKQAVPDLRDAEIQEMLEKPLSDIFK